MNHDDFSRDLERQRNAQVEITKHQTVVQRLQAIKEQIKAFENRYSGTFEDLFGHLSDLAIYGMSEAVDITDWKELVQIRKRLLVEELDRNDIPDGVYAVHPDPNDPKVKVRKLVDWCRVNGIPLSEAHRLPRTVMEQFLEYPNKDRAKDEREQD
ncbi:hypothetical protein NZD89_02110 [Alicyclobacillus fastidiosus]|uniref:Uncharacterized protein n=1 Tax=Alicyclobacillus fastidiosus TaxID=392011 RepID=A0ABY6ZHF5_9BACL|nr:hypothetical protein [Alicyclobacillus fastidiosus]WAH42323.1 hypothetical protein NZD89_02110 [Alicyclobacillus fastidiosus]GMA64131.1 hypothetical protein GCM10025859_45710 [Alicyclobacillus fastidiosus]